MTFFFFFFLLCEKKFVAKNFFLKKTDLAFLSSFGIKATAVVLEKIE